MPWTQAPPWSPRSLCWTPVRRRKAKPLRRCKQAMTTTIQPLTESKAWKSLTAHSKEINKLQLRQLFAQDAKRGERFTVEAAGLFLDYSKNRITDETLKLLLQLAEESNLRAKRDAMFGGEKINI